MDERTQRVDDLLLEAGEVHHVVYRITDGADDDGAPSMRTGSSITASFPKRSGAHRPVATSYASSSSPSGLVPSRRRRHAGRSSTPIGVGEVADLVDEHRAAVAANVMVRAEHEVVEEQLPAALEEVEQRGLARRPIEDVVLLDVNP